MTPARYQRHFLKALALIQHARTCWIYELAIIPSNSLLDFPKSSWLSKWADIAWYGTYNVAWCLHSLQMRNQSFFQEILAPGRTGPSPAWPGMIQELISRVLLQCKLQSSGLVWQTEGEGRFPTVARPAWAPTQNQAKVGMFYQVEPGTGEEQHDRMKDVC